MAWFKRQKQSSYGPIVFTTKKDAEEQQRRLEAAGITGGYTERRDGNTYITYQGTDPEKAKAYLREREVPNDRTYIVVETDDGTWGTDSSSLYLEHLRPWQLNTDADCEGELTSLIDGFHNYTLAARGTVDNFLAQIACGDCGHEWIDGIRYNDRTLVRCPACRSTNRVDTAPLLDQFRVY
jgi:hypothetical protein